jgi:hypothetical protein
MMERAKAWRRLTSVALLLVLAACASGSSKTSATAASTSSSNTVQLSSKLPAGTGLATTFDVALAGPATPGAQAAAAAIGERIGACWKGPDAPDAPAVLLKLTLAQDGSVGAVETIEKKRFAAEPAYRASATAATRAVLQCAPFSLSAADFAAWKSLALKLTPRHA